MGVGPAFMAAGGPAHALPKVTRSSWLQQWAQDTQLFKHLHTCGYLEKQALLKNQHSVLTLSSSVGLGS